MSEVTKLRVSIHREGYKFIAISFAISIVIFLFVSKYIGLISFVLPLFVAYFFRNPVRHPPSGDHLVLSPADGIVSAIKFDEPPKSLNIGDEHRYCVSVFLSVFNVHINRIPVTGVIDDIIYTPGKFINASLDKSSLFNERNTIVVTAKYNNKKIAFTQIAGLIARRIVCYGYVGQSIEHGKIFGMIRFGSRCDVWLPIGSEPSVIEGQTMVAGESIICDMSLHDNNKLPE